MCSTQLYETRSKCLCTSELAAPISMCSAWTALGVNGFINHHKPHIYIYIYISRKSPESRQSKHISVTESWSNAWGLEGSLEVAENATSFQSFPLPFLIHDSFLWSVTLSFSVMFLMFLTLHRLHLDDLRIPLGEMWHLTLETEIHVEICRYFKHL